MSECRDNIVKRFIEGKNIRSNKWLHHRRGIFFLEKTIYWKTFFLPSSSGSWVGIESKKLIYFSKDQTALNRNHLSIRAKRNTHLNHGGLIKIIRLYRSWWYKIWILGYKQRAINISSTIYDASYCTWNKLIKQ